MLYSMSQKKSPPTVFWNFFRNGWEFFYQFLHTYYTRVQIFNQISPTLTTLCYTKRDHLVKFYISLPQTTINKAINDLRLNARVFVRFGHFAHIMWTGQSRLIWHNFVKIGDNWIEICNLAKIGTFNRCVKKSITNSQPFVKKWKNVRSLRGGGIFWLTL